MELRKFKEKNPKKVGIILFTITCILLISGVILYRTFAIFQVDTTQNVINGSIEDPGDIYFAFYKDGNIQKEMPKKSDGYVLDESKSYCGVTGTNTDTIKVTMSEDEVIQVSGVATSRTKCNLYFVKGIYILGKGVPTVESGDGLYEVTHKDVTGINTGFTTKEYRYAGSNPDNYIKFNDEDWRIIGLVNVTTSNNNVEQRVKILKNENTEERKWDDNNKNDWTKATLNTYLNGDYYNKLNNNAQSMIDDNVLWNLGGHTTSVQKTDEFYKIERGSVTYNNQPSTWKGKIALISPSDYGYSTGGTTRENCLQLTIDGSGWGQNQECITNTWFFKDDKIYYTIMQQSNSANYIFIVGKNLTGGYGAAVIEAVMPTLYLKQNVKIINDTNNGSETFPYQLEQIIR